MNKNQLGTTCLVYYSSPTHARETIVKYPLSG